MLSNIIKKNREAFFPECKDFTSNLDHIRNEEDPKKLSYNAFFWGSPYNFKIMYYGSPGASMVMFGIVAYATRGWIGIIPLISLAFCGVMAYDMIRKLRKWKEYKNTTMYDMYMRDYVVDVHE